MTFDIVETGRELHELAKAGAATTAVIVAVGVVYLIGGWDLVFWQVYGATLLTVVDEALDLDLFES